MRFVLLQCASLLRYASAMMKSGNDIAAIRVSAKGVRTVTVAEALKKDSSYAFKRLEGAIEDREIELKYFGESTLPLFEFLRDWVHAPQRNTRKRGREPLRRKQAVTALLMRDWLGLSWKRIVGELEIQWTEQQSLENRVSELRALVHEHGLKLDVAPPRGR